MRWRDHLPANHKTTSQLSTFWVSVAKLCLGICERANSKVKVKLDFQQKWSWSLERVQFHREASEVWVQVPPRLCIKRFSTQSLWTFYHPSLLSFLREEKILNQIYESSTCICQPLLSHLPLQGVLFCYQVRRQMVLFPFFFPTILLMKSTTRQRNF